MSGKYWRTGKAGMPQSTGLQIVIHDQVTEQQKSQTCVSLVLLVLHQDQKQKDQKMYLITSRAFVRP